MPEIVIGVIVENGAGKGKLIRMLREEFTGHCAVFSTGRVLLRTLEPWHIPPTRANMQLLPPIMEKAFGMGALARAMSIDIAQSTEPIVFYDAVRLYSDVDAVRGFKRSMFVYVTAEKKLRYERLKPRREKTGEAGMTWGQFLEEESAPTEAFIPIIARKEADKVIDNNGDEMHLHMQALSLCESIQAALG